MFIRPVFLSLLLPLRACRFFVFCSDTDRDRQRDRGVISQRARRAKTSRGYI